MTNKTSIAMTAVLSCKRTMRKSKQPELRVKPTAKYWIPACAGMTIRVTVTLRLDRATQGRKKTRPSINRREPARN